jgi:hypothetical protein
MNVVTSWVSIGEMIWAVLRLDELIYVEKGL